MTIENNDRLLVNRGSTSHQIKYEKIKQDIAESVAGSVNDAPDDGKQYGRQDSGWTEIVHTPEYTDADVDAHLNTNLANGGQILSWDGVDYKWVADQTGSGGGGSSDASLVSYQYPSGVSRSVESRLNDSVSVKDFGAKGDGVTDDTVAFNAAIQTGRQVNIPAGTYVLSSTITSTGRNVTFIGEGSRNTYLQFTNNSDGFSVDIDQNNDANYTAHFEGFRIHSTNDSNAAIRIRTANPVGEIFNMAILENLHVSGRWGQGIVLDSCRMSKLRNITLGLNRATEGIALINLCMDSVLSNIVCSNVLNGIGAAIFIGGEAEGIHIEQSTIINCTVGIHAEATGGFEPSLFISDTHTNCRRYGIFSKNFGQLNIHDNLLYAWTTSDVSQLVDYNGIYVENAGSDSVIANNIFHHAGRGSNPGAEEKGIVWNSASPFANISGNMFYQGEVGIEAFNNAEEISASANHFNGVTDPYRASSGNISSSSLDITESSVRQEIKNTGSRQKNVGLTLNNNDKNLKLTCLNDGGGVLSFEDNMQFTTKIGDTTVESLRLNDNGTARFYSDLFVSKNGVYDQNLSVNSDFNVVGNSDFAQNVNVSRNIIAQGNVTAGTNLYVGEAGNPNQRWLISVDSNGNIITVRQ